MVDVSYYPKDPCTAPLWTLVPNTIPGITLGTKVLKWAVHGLFGLQEGIQLKGSKFHTRAPK